MKKHLIIVVLSAAVIAAAAVSCDKPSECPKIDNGYKKSIILPSPQQLSETDRAYLQQIRDEYNTNKDQ